MCAEEIGIEMVSRLERVNSSDDLLTTQVSCQLESSIATLFYVPDEAIQNEITMALRPPQLAAYANTSNPVVRNGFRAADLARRRRFCLRLIKPLLTVASLFGHLV
jgi:hypothetical protein